MQKPLWNKDLRGKDKRLLCKQDVGGSNPSGSTFYKLFTLLSILKSGFFHL